MTKKELVDVVMKNEDISKAQSERIINLIFGEITNSLADGQEVSIPGFGKFEPIHRPAYQGINPSTKEKIIIPASVRPKFKAAKQLKVALN